MPGKDDWIETARRRMVGEILSEVAETRRWLGRDALDPAVIRAMGRVPRHEFVPEINRVYAYENRPLPIGHGQTISQPYIVAIMADLAGARAGAKVLEVGTGCGYQAAVLADIGCRVTTIELVPELARDAAGRLSKLGYDAVTVHQGDGSKGWPADAPYDAIVVTAAAFQRVPPALIEQLAPGGRMVVPVQRVGGFDPFDAAVQDLTLVTKDEAGSIEEESILPVAFVPLIEPE